MERGCRSTNLLTYLLTHSLTYLPAQKQKIPSQPLLHLLTFFGSSDFPVDRELFTSPTKQAYVMQIRIVNYQKK